MSQLTLTVAPAQHGRSIDIDDVQPLNDRDLTCLAAVRDVLEEYGLRERFGIALLHKHFDMAEDEILVEYACKEDRVLTIKPVKKDEAGSVIETIWEMGDSNGNKAILGCRQYCGKDIHGNHTSFHGMT
jgi:hypothetical protein